MKKIALLVSMALASGAYQTLLKQKHTSVVSWVTVTSMMLVTSMNRVMMRALLSVDTLATTSINTLQLNPVGGDISSGLIV